MNKNEKEKLHWTLLMFLNTFQDNVGGISSIPEDELTQRMRGTNSADPNMKSLVQCFPLYSILLAIGNPVIDLFSLDIEG